RRKPAADRPRAGADRDRRGGRAGRPGGVIAMATTERHEMTHDTRLRRANDAVLTEMARSLLREDGPPRAGMERRPDQAHAALGADGPRPDRGALSPGGSPSLRRRSPRRLPSTRLAL